MGEVVIAYPQAKRQAEQRGVALGDELALLTVHGVLHLAGHDHADPRNRPRCRQKERAAWKRCRLPPTTGRRLDDHPGLLSQVASGQLCRAGGAGARGHNAAAVRQARPDIPFLPVLRPARVRQDHYRPDHRQGGKLPDLQDGDPCNQCAICQAINDGRFMDIIELDAASNRGIDEIRDIRDKVNFSPAQGSRKVYIIDEAHMLTDAAANAFLKTLEERRATLYSSCAPPRPTR